LPVFEDRPLALDETAQVKEEDVRNSIIVLFTFVITDNYCKNDE
jgi:hypothetical protein